MARTQVSGLGFPWRQRGIAQSNLILTILLILVVAALVYCCVLDQDDDGSGPSSKYVKFKNRGGTGKRVLPGMDVDWSKKADASTKDGPVKHGFPEILDGADAVGGMNVTVPPFAKSYVFTFELEDGTKFVNAPCLCPMVFGGLDIRHVEAELKSRQKGPQVVYWLEFQIEYDDYYDFPRHPPTTGLTAVGVPTDEVPAGTVKTWP